MLFCTETLSEPPRYTHETDLMTVLTPIDDIKRPVKGEHVVSDRKISVEQEMHQGVLSETLSMHQ